MPGGSATWKFARARVHEIYRVRQEPIPYGEIAQHMRENVGKWEEEQVRRREQRRETMEDECREEGESENSAESSEGSAERVTPLTYRRRGKRPLLESSVYDVSTNTSQGFGGVGLFFSGRQEQESHAGAVLL